MDHLKERAAGVGGPELPQARLQADDAPEALGDILARLGFTAALVGAAACTHARSVAVRAWIGDRFISEGEVCRECCAERVRRDAPIGGERFWPWTRGREHDRQGAHFEPLDRARS